MTATRPELERFLRRCEKQEFLDALTSNWLNDLFPGIRRLIGCDQGKVVHNEGDAALHSWMVLTAVTSICLEELKREADFTELLAALMHDWKKPVTRVVGPDGNVSFPGHEAMAGAEVDRVAVLLDLDQVEKAKLFCLVARHGEFTCFPELSADKQREFQTSPFVESVCLFQKADATSAHSAAGGHWPVYWSQIQPTD